MGLATPMILLHEGQEGEEFKSHFSRGWTRGEGGGSSSSSGETGENEFGKNDPRSPAKRGGEGVEARDKGGGAAGVHVGLTRGLSRSESKKFTDRKTTEYRPEQINLLAALKSKVKISKLTMFEASKETMKVLIVA
jgi:hypothetical protein